MLRYLLTITTLALLLSGCASTTGLFFYPRSVWIETPADHGFVYKDVGLTAADGTSLHAWWIPAQQQRGTILFLHGNAENISSHTRSVYWLVEAGFNVLALDYRGFGASAGHALMPSVLQDVRAAADWIRAEQPQESFWLLGQSMGAALALDFAGMYADKYALAGVVVDAPFTGFPAIARDALSHSLLGWLVMPLTLLVPGHWDPIDYVSQIQAPVMVIHSATDKVIPHAHGQALYRVLSQRSDQTTCWLESRGRHIETFRYTGLKTATLDFLQTGVCPAFTGD